MSSTAPTDTIPPELLCEIFLTATAWERLIGDNIPMVRQHGVSDYASFMEYLNVSTYGDVPTTVSHVCQYWRNLAIATPPLWSLILLFKKSDLEKNKLWLQRSGGAELDVVLDMTIYYHSEAALQFENLAFNASEVFDQGFSLLNMHLHRCRHLTLGSNRPFSSCSPSSYLVNLKPFVRLVCLQSLYLNGQESSLSHITDLLKCPELARLSRLRIEHMIGVGEHRLFALLKVARNLTALEMINVNTMNWSEEVDVIYLPKLTIFTLWTVHGGFESIFSALDAPHLQTLSLGGRYDRGRIHDINIARRSCHIQRTLRSVKTLTLREMYLPGDAEHPWMFYFLDSLEVLILHMEDLDGKFLQSICIESRQFLPKLKALVCHDIIESAGDEIYLEEALRRRKVSRMTLPKLVFHISNPSHPSWMWPGTEVYIPSPEEISKFRESVPVVQIFRYRTPNFLWKETCTLGPE